jgi:hypothetical protein
VSGNRLRAMISFAVVAVAAFLCVDAAGAQESWQPARGGASSWGAGSAAGTSASKAGAGAFGGGAGWDAGKANFGSVKQPGGVWVDGSTLPAAESKSTAKAITAGNPPSGDGGKLTGIHSELPTSPGSAPQSKTAVSHAGLGSSSSKNLHPGMANGGRGGSAKLSSPKSSALPSRGRTSSHGGTSAISGFGKPKVSEPGMSPEGGSAPTGTPGLDAPSEPGDPKL